MKSKNRRYLNKKVGLRSNKASATIEVVAALMIIIPFVISIAYIAAGAAQICTIKHALSITAATAARRLAISYGEDSETAMAKPETAFSGVSFLNIVTKPNQFSVPAGTQGWNLTASTPTVTVETKFSSSNYSGGLLWYPTLFNQGNPITITARATQALEGS